ncbi:MAG: hypothetical protein IKH39_00685 [Candidatus Methanomethylophilaceae archaeon]|nr:hypothetical protein [Candidatus Methanomethylophilaceae archaeon]MBR4225559.1 hypothetical protein [Candidatus Methanomethylophilaceae archaeon]
MTFDFHKNRYESRRGPGETTVRVRVPRELRTELLALSIAMEEPMDSIIRRIVEEYVDSHQADVKEGMRMISPECRPQEHGRMQERDDDGRRPKENRRTDRQSG